MGEPAPGALWGRSTLSWKLNSRWFVLLGGPRAAILQVADPAVAAGVADYSAYRTDPLGRLERTLEAMLAIGFAPPARRAEVLARLERIHRRVQGTTAAGEPYEANDPDLQYWVLATLVDTVLEVERRFVGRLRERDRERYFEESTALAAAFGVPDALVPADLREFRAYVQDRFATLRPSAQSVDITASLMRPGLRFLPDPAFVPLNWVTATLLPGRLRRELGVADLNAPELAAVRSSALVMRATLPHLHGFLGSNPLNGRAIRGGTAATRARAAA